MLCILRGEELVLEGCTNWTRKMAKTPMNIGPKLDVRRFKVNFFKKGFDGREEHRYWACPMLR